MFTQGELVSVAPSNVDVNDILVVIQLAGNMVDVCGYKSKTQRLPVKDVFPVIEPENFDEYFNSRISEDMLVCPFCGDHRLSSGPLVNGGSIYIQQNVTCQKCSNKWMLSFEFSELRMCTPVKMNDIKAELLDALLNDRVVPMREAMNNPKADNVYKICTRHAPNDDVAVQAAQDLIGQMPWLGYSDKAYKHGLTEFQYKDLLYTLSAIGIKTFDTSPTFEMHTGMVEPAALIGDAHYTRLEYMRIINGVDALTKVALTLAYTDEHKGKSYQELRKAAVELILR